MKKILLFVLLLAVLCFTACDDKANDANTELGAGSNTDMTPVGAVDETVEEPVEDPHEGWTKVFGDVYVPDLPFEDWDGQNQDNINCFTIFIHSRNSEAFHAYAQSLTDFGYTIEQKDDYYYSGTDPEGRSVSLFDPENGNMQFSIYY